MESAIIFLGTKYLFLNVLKCQIFKYVLIIYLDTTVLTLTLQFVWEKVQTIMGHCVLAAKVNIALTNDTISLKKSQKTRVYVRIKTQKEGKIALLHLM